MPQNRKEHVEKLRLERGDRVLMYTAVVRLTLESSHVELNANVSEPLRSEALWLAPEFAPDGWPPPGVSKDRTSLELVGIYKFYEMMQAGDERLANSSRVTLQLVRERRPLVAHRIEMGYDVEEFKTLPVEAEIWSNGEATWGYSHGPKGQFPPGVSTVVRPGRGSELDLFIQKLVRADLEVRLERSGLL